MTDDSLLPFDLPSVQRKKVSAAFDGGLILLREAERRLRLAETLAGCIRDRRNQAQLVHSLSAMLRLLACWPSPVVMRMPAWKVPACWGLRHFHGNHDALLPNYRAFMDVPMMQATLF